MVGRKQAGIWLGVLISAVLWAQIGAAAPSHVAEIIGINGQVEARARGGAFSPAAILQKLSSQDAVRTLANSKAELSFIDQSITVLGEKTTLEIGQYSLGERAAAPTRALKVVDGSVRQVVNKFFGGGTGEPEVTVDTPTMGVGIRGTDLIIEVKGGIVSVYLLEAGRPVALRSKSTGELADLRPGFFAIGQKGLPIRIFPLTDDLRRKLLRQFNFVFEVRPKGIAIKPELPLAPPTVVGPETGPTGVLSPVYTPPPPVPTPPPHYPIYQPSPPPSPSPGFIER